MIPYATFKENASLLRMRVDRAAERCGRDGTAIRILPVTKTFPANAVAYCLEHGFAAVGENRVQEVVEKQGSLRERIRWELIGHLQSNKVKLALEHFDAVQSVDSVKLLEKLQRGCEAMGRDVEILLQVNAGYDPAKHGFEPELLHSAVGEALKCDRLRLKGLMTIAPLCDDPAVARTTFSNLRRLLDRVNRDFGLAMAELSMGMSDDLEIAVEEGSTCVRVGSALFGVRIDADTSS
jgi:PLP dependent protein